MTQSVPPHSPDPPADRQAQAGDDLAGQARGWIVRLASGEIDETGLAEFEAWVRTPLHRAAFARQRELWRALAPLREAFESPVAAESLAIAASAPVSSALATSALTSPAPTAIRPRPPRRRRAIGAGLAIAACLFAAIAAAPAAWLQWRADYRSDTAPRRYLLSDGSEAVLDADSAIAIDYRDGRRRIELLRGGAWFRVAHGDPRPFLVDALGGTSRDIGTAFEVAIQDERVRTAVSDGQVEVRSAGDAAVSVRAGQFVSYQEGRAASQPRPIDPADIAAWRRGELLLDAVPAEQALHSIARYRRGPVWTLGSFAGLPKISATLRTDRPDEAIQAIASRAGLRLRRLPGGALLVRPPAG